MFDVIPGSQVSVRLYDAVQVGRLDVIDEFDVYVDGVRIPRSIVLGIEVEGMQDVVDSDYHEECGHFHGMGECPEGGPCGDYRCCIG